MPRLYKKTDFQKDSSQGFSNSVLYFNNYILTRKAKAFQKDYFKKIQAKAFQTV